MELRKKVIFYKIRLDINNRKNRAIESGYITLTKCFKVVYCL